VESGLHYHLCVSLRASSLTVTFAPAPAVAVLEDVDFVLEAGCFDMIAGANGAGKSTLLRALAGLLKPTRGHVSLGPHDLDELSLAARARQIGFLPQEIAPAFAYSVAETVALGARVAGIGHWFDHGHGATVAHAVDAALEQVDALSLRDRRLAELSGGERRRVLIASVLAQQPRFLLLDEPAAMLDLAHQSELFGLLRRLTGEGLGVCCVTHDWNLAVGFADRLTVLHEHRVLASGPPAELLNAKLLDTVFGPHFTLLTHADGRPVVVPR
jgi:iron complex transport system ATP-binding protein